MAKLTKEDVLEIRRLANTLNDQEIAEKYGMDDSYIRRIIKRKAWKSIPITSEDYPHTRSRPNANPYALRGEDNPSAKLNAQDIAFIRNSSLDSRVLSKQFGVTIETIRGVISRDSWKHDREW